MKQEPEILFVALIDGKEVEVTYDMLSLQSKRLWDSGAIKANLVGRFSFKVDGEPIPAEPWIKDLFDGLD